VPQAQKQKIAKGEMVFRQRGNLLAIKWQDKREVAALSTVHHNTITVLTKSDKEDGVPLSKPTLIMDYNNSMGGVDLADQLGKYYGFCRKTKK
jgi:hypothetical protein